MTLTRSSAQSNADHTDVGGHGSTSRTRLGMSRLWRSGWVWSLLLTLPALAPLLRAGFFVSDDGLFHVYRIAALAEAWQQGVLYPRLFPQFGFGYGQAVLNFYAPLSYAPGALLASLGLTPAAAAEWTIALGFILAAWAAYGAGNYLWGKTGGVLAAVIYTYFPYHLADAYQRGALPEHLAFIFLPLIVWATIAAFRDKQPIAAYLWASLAWTGLVYTHNLTVLLMGAAWLALVLILALTSQSWRRFWGLVLSGALAVGLSAWVWLPFLAESGYVGIGLGPSAGYSPTPGATGTIDPDRAVLPLSRGAWGWGRGASGGLAGRTAILWPCRLAGLAASDRATGGYRAASRVRAGPRRCGCHDDQWAVAARMAAAATDPRAVAVSVAVHDTGRVGAGVGSRRGRSAGAGAGCAVYPRRACLETCSAGSSRACVDCAFRGPLHRLWAGAHPA